MLYVRPNRYRLQYGENEYNPACLLSVRHYGHVDGHAARHGLFDFAYHKFVYRRVHVPRDMGFHRFRRQSHAGNALYFLSHQLGADRYRALRHVYRGFQKVPPQG